MSKTIRTVKKERKKGGSMKIKKLIKTLKQFDQNDNVQVYILENGGDLVHANIESILDTEIGCELTVEKDVWEY